MNSIFRAAKSPLNTERIAESKVCGLITLCYAFFMFYILFNINSDAEIKNIANNENCNLSLLFNFLLNQSVFTPIGSKFFIRLLINPPESASE